MKHHGVPLKVGVEGPTSMLTWQLCDFLWDPDQYCKETLYFCDFSGGPAPSGSAHVVALTCRVYLVTFCLDEHSDNSA